MADERLKAFEATRTARELCTRLDAAAQAAREAKDEHARVVHELRGEMDEQVAALERTLAARNEIVKELRAMIEGLESTSSPSSSSRSPRSGTNAVHCGCRRGADKTSVVVFST